MQVEKSFLENARGERMAVAVYLPQGAAKSTIVVSHGLESTKESQTYIELAKASTGLGARVVLFDHRGRGESQGEFKDTTIENRLEDLSLVVESLKLTEFGLLGSSYGGAVSLFFAASSKEVKALVLLAPAVPFPENSGVEHKKVLEAEKAVVTESGARLDWSFLEDWKSHSQQFPGLAKKITAPTLIIQGKNDKSSLPKHSRKLYEELVNCDRELAEFAGEEHQLSEDAKVEAARLAANWFNEKL